MTDEAVQNLAQNLASILLAREAKLCARLNVAPIGRIGIGVSRNDAGEVTALTVSPCL